VLQCPQEARQDPNVLAKGKTDTGRIWVYVRDDKPFGGPAPPAAAFYYSRDRAGEHAQAHLATYSGIFQGEDEDWLHEICTEMDPASSAPAKSATTAFTDFGVDNITELVKIYKADPDLLWRYPPK